MRARLHDEIVLRDRRIVEVDVVRDNGRYLPCSAAEKLAGRRLTGVLRKGKVLYIEADGLVVRCHNGMSGYWDTARDPWTFDYVEGRRTSSQSDVRVELRLDDGDSLRFHDARLFGSLELMDRETADGDRRRLGPDVMASSQEAIQSLLKECDRRPLRPIKDALMDQRVVSGIGNIYSSEGLWRARVRPDRMLQEVGPLEQASVIVCVVDSMITAMESNIDYSKLKIYRRKCQKHGIVEKIQVKGRSSYFCPECQR